LQTAKFPTHLLSSLLFAASTAIAASTVITACTATSPYGVTNVGGSPGSYVVAAERPAEVRNNTVAQGVKETERQGEPEKKRPEAGALERKRTATQKKTDRKAAEERKGVLREADGQGQEISLFIKNDGEEEDLSSLLTADYLRQFDIPIVFNDAVQYFVKYFTTEKRKIMANWLKRSRRYVPMIKEILREHKLPEDLIYLAMIESGFNPKAYSSMKACGPWQFIYETGGRYGLRVDHWVDQRRDPEKSTVAAALYLKDLFNQFGNWYLAAAGYNAGEKRIERAVEMHETSDFWELSKYNTLPRETREYIPRLLAAAIIAKEPERFGFTNINYDQPVRFVNEKVPGATPLTAIARAASTDLTTLRALNPELLTGITPPDADDYSIKLPEWVKVVKFRDDLRAALEGAGRVEQVITHTCKKRETLASVMRQHRVTHDDLLLVNNCDQTLVAKQGSVIYIPKFSGQTDAVETETNKATQDIGAVAMRETTHEAPTPKGLSRPSRVKVRLASGEKPSDARKDFHIVKKGEKLADISEKYGVDLATLKEINKLKKNVIHANMRLMLTSARVEKTEKRERPAVYHPSKKKVAISGAVAKHTTSSLNKEKSRTKKKSAPRSAAKPKTKSVKAKRAARG
jgi:membrane-bound lytic murein transglycosylase D